MHLLSRVTGETDRSTPASRMAGKPGTTIGIILMDILDKIFEPKKDIGILFIRILVGVHLIIGVQDNILSWERMVEFSYFLDHFGFPVPVISAVVSVYLQFICAVLFLVGWKIRYAAVVMIFNFVIALIMVHLGNDPYPVVFPALVMLGGSLCFLFSGAGAVSLDHYLAIRKETTDH